MEKRIQGARLILQVAGRLDATWSEHLLSEVRDVLREGHHQVLLDAEDLQYISSAGIRSLLKIRRELESVNGSFGIVRATAMVRDVLRMSGLASLLVSEETSAAAVPSQKEGQSETSVSGIRFECHELSAAGKITVGVHAGWKPWDMLTSGSIRELALPRTRFGLGIGAAGRDAEDASGRFGEFVAASGFVAWLPGDGAEQPDYLEQSERFLPRLQTIQAIVGEGSFSKLLRFRPEAKESFLDAADLYEQVLRTTQSDMAALVGLVEVEGLVGAAMARSPGLIKPGDKPGQFPEIREWLSFCGERVHRQAQALLVAFIGRGESRSSMPHMAALPSRPELYAHAHAAVLAFRPLPQGVLDLDTSVKAVFEDNAPSGVLHLMEDNRPAVGLGQSRFIRGACWCAPAQFSTEALA